VLTGGDYTLGGGFWGGGATVRPRVEQRTCVIARRRYVCTDLRDKRYIDDAHKPVESSVNISKKGEKRTRANC
jgi:hypothetical protein